jgi:hypothetical protein
MATCEHVGSPERVGRAKLKVSI